MAPLLLLARIPLPELYELLLCLPSGPSEQVRRAVARRGGASNTLALILVDSGRAWSAAPTASGWRPAPPCWSSDTCPALPYLSPAQIDRRVDSVMEATGLPLVHRKRREPLTAEELKHFSGKKVIGGADAPPEAGVRGWLRRKGLLRESKPAKPSGAERSMRDLVMHPSKLVRRRKKRRAPGDDTAAEDDEEDDDDLGGSAEEEDEEEEEEEEAEGDAKNTEDSGDFTGRMGISPGPRIPRRTPQTDSTFSLPRHLWPHIRCAAACTAVK